MKTVRLAMTGFGNVGQGVATLLGQLRQRFEQEYGLSLLLSGVADRGGAAVAASALELGDLLRSKQASGSVAASQHGQRGLRGRDFLEAASADVLIEAASTNFTDAEPGWSYCRDGLELGIHLVLASKGALVLHYDKLMQASAERGLRVLFSGTTGAPLPVLELADRMLVGATITGFQGIVNATSNYILTAMGEGASYDEAVRGAQRVGIAETDPSLDVDGWDAAAKVVIITRAVLGERIQITDVERQGIRNVTAATIHDAAEKGMSLRSIARAERTNQGVRASVLAEKRPVSDVLGGLQGQEMGIVFDTEPLGRVTSTVQECGGIPTALTVLRDVINLARDEGWAR